MPRLACTFDRFLEIILAHGFELHRHGGTSHRRYRRVVDGVVYFVDYAAHNGKDQIKLGTLKSMIRQSGLPEELFESARIDGAGDLTMLWKIAIPLSAGILGTLTILNVIWAPRMLAS